MESDTVEGLVDRMEALKTAPACLELSPWLWQALQRKRAAHPNLQQSGNGDATVLGIPFYKDEALRPPAEKIELGIIFYSWEERVRYREMGGMRRLIYAVTTPGDQVQTACFTPVGLGKGFTSESPPMRREDSITLIYERSDERPDQAETGASDD